MALFRDWNISNELLGGTTIITSLEMTKLVEDWSKVRSPGRARRRLKRGYKQNVEYRRVPRRDAMMLDGGRTMIVHPVFLKEIGERVGRAMEKRMDRLLTEQLFGLEPRPLQLSDLQALAGRPLFKQKDTGNGG